MRVSLCPVTRINLSVMSKQYRINEFAARVGRATSTVRRWEREGKLTAKRMPSGHRYFDESDVRALLGGAPERRLTVVYCRVSSAGQKDDLASQVKAMEAFCLASAIPVDEWIKEVACNITVAAPVARVCARPIVIGPMRPIRSGFGILLGCPGRWRAPSSTCSYSANLVIQANT